MPDHKRESVEYKEIARDGQHVQCPAIAKKGQQYNILHVEDICKPLPLIQVIYKIDCILYTKFIHDFCG